MADVNFTLPNTTDVVELAKSKMAADIAKAEAETANLLGERQAQKAILKQLNAGARQSEADARVAELRVIETQLQHDIEMARNFHHSVYRFHERIDATSVSDCINTLTVWDRMRPEAPFEIVFNSPGGSVIDGFELFDFLQEMRRKGHHVTTATRGMAASMGDILLQAGDRRVMGREAVVLIHEVSTIALGKIGEIEDEVELVHKLQARALRIFAEGSKRAFDNGTAEIALTVDQLKNGDRPLGISGWSRRDWWLTSDECIKYGIVDELR